MIEKSRLSCFGHVERSPNLLSPNVFSVVKLVRNALAPNPAGDYLYRFPRRIAGPKGWKENRK